MNCSESCLCGSEISSWLLAEVVLRNDEEEKEIEGVVFVMLISKFFTELKVNYTFMVLVCCVAD